MEHKRNEPALPTHREMSQIEAGMVCGGAMCSQNLHRWGEVFEEWNQENDTNAWNLLFIDFPSVIQHDLFGCLCVCVHEMRYYGALAFVAANSVNLLLCYIIIKCNIWCHSVL